MSYFFIFSIAMIFLFSHKIYADDMMSESFHVPISDEYMNFVSSMFPERRVNSDFIDADQDPLLFFTGQTNLDITFLSEGAGYRNSFGYYLLDENDQFISQRQIFNNASAVGSGGNLGTGDSVMIQSTPEASYVGFYIKANGFRNRYGNVFYTEESRNGDGLDHVATYYDVEDRSLVMGFEDLWRGGDRDYNDLLIKVSASNIQALENAVLEAGISTTLPTQQLEQATGMVEMTVDPYAKVSGLD